MNRLVSALAVGTFRKTLPDWRTIAVNLLKSAYIGGFWVGVAYALFTLLG